MKKIFTPKLQSYLQKIITVSLIFSFAGFLSLFPPQKASADITTGLLGHWAFNDGSGTSPVDSSGNSHTGTFVDVPTWQAGRVGSGALQFDGTDDALTLAAPTTLNANTYTISFWMNGSASFTGTVFRLTKSSSITASNSKYQIDVTPSSVMFRTGDGTASSDDDTYSTTLTAGSWWHIACTLNGSNVKSCYRNGVLISSTTNDVDITLNTLATAVAYVASRRSDTQNNNFEGLIDDLRVYSRALSESDIQELFALGADTTDPSVPTNLATTSVSASRVALSWDASTDNVGVTGYKVFRNSVEIGTTTNTTYVDAGLSVNTTYSYTVSAYDQEANESSQSAAAEVTTAASTFEVIQGGGGDYTTIGDCVVDAQPGDTCNVHTGTYSETVTPTVSGTYAYPISIQTNNNDVVNLTGVNFDSVDFVRIEDINVQTISQWGVTWTFDNYYQIGLFANEDFWVLGPVTVNSISPGYDGTLNGWQVNPAVSDEQGFDGRVAASFNASLVPSLPYTSIAPIESLVKTISSVASENSYIQTAAVVTVLSSVPTNNGATIFRPPYMGTSKPLYTTSELHTEYLSSLVSVGTPPSIATVADRFKKLRLEHMTFNQRSFRPIDAYGDTGTDGYGPQVSQYNAGDILRLLLNDSLSDKMPALIGVTQHGLDQAHAVIGGMRNPGTGHDPGHALMASFAAAMLDITDAKTVLQSADDFEENDYTTSGLNSRSLWGGNSTEGQYWIYIVSGDGNRAHKDPYGFIDGGSLDRAGYQLILSQSYKGSVLVGSLIPQIYTTAWNPAEWTILSGYAERWEGTGYWTQPDPCAPYDGNPANQGVTYGPDPANPGMCILDADLEYYNSSTDFACQDGQQCGRFPTYHGTQTDAGQYEIAFVTSMWDSYFGTVSSVYTVSGTVTGLSGTLVLQNNSGDNETITSNGLFIFDTALANSASYSVTILTQPTGQTCTVSNGSGTIASANVTNVSVTCTTNSTPTPTPTPANGPIYGSTRHNISNLLATTTPPCTTSTSTISLTRNLSRGSQGNDVTALQNFLVSKNFLTSDSVTGYFGITTETAVKAFQKSSGLVYSGTPQTTGYGNIGPVTRAKINSLGTTTTCTPTQINTVIPTSTSYNFARNLSLNMTGEDVRQLQQFLNTNGFTISTTGVGSPGNETTLFGALTYKALQKFQKSVGLPATGFFGPMTREYLNKK